MNINVFFDEIKAWIHKCNTLAVEKGMDSDDFWNWVTLSIAEISERYNNNDLVKRQLIMLYEWLYDTYIRMKKAG